MLVKSKIKEWFWGETLVHLLFGILILGMFFSPDGDIRILAAILAAAGCLFEFARYIKYINLLQKADDIAERRCQSKIRKAWAHVAQNDKIERRRSLLLEVRNALNDGLSLEKVDQIVCKESPLIGFYGIRLKFEFDENLEDIPLGEKARTEEKGTSPYAKLVLVHSPKPETWVEVAAISLI